ncbi:MAG: MFS transporter [Thermoflexaceae bacterium]|nr:MFS transporter [Thermoflexaceae bacterium]
MRLVKRTWSTPQTFRALRHRNYRLLWLGQTGHSASLWMDQVARAVLILELTGSALMLSLVIAARLVPILLFGLIAGAVADRSDRKRVLFTTQMVTFATHLFLGVMVTAGLIEAWHVFVTALVAGTAMAFNQPVRQSLIPMTVPREDLANAVALNSLALSVMRVGGGSLAGALLIFLSTGGVYLVNACIYALVILSTSAIRLPPREAPSGERPGLFADLGEGFAYVARNPNLGVIAGLSLVLFVFGFPYQQVFVPLLATGVLEMGNSGVGFLAGATGVGAVAGTLFIASRPHIARPGLQLFINLFVFGAALAAISLQATVLGTALLLAVAGSMTVTYMALTNTILLENSSPEMHGRVMSLLSLDRGLIPLGAILAGVLASSLGTRRAIFTMGALVLVMASLAFFLAGRRVLRIRSEVAVVETDPAPAPAVAGHGR